MWINTIVLCTCPTDVTKILQCSCAILSGFLTKLWSRCIRYWNALLAKQGKMILVFLLSAQKEAGKNSSYIHICPLVLLCKRISVTCCILYLMQLREKIYGIFKNTTNIILYATIVINKQRYQPYTYSGQKRNGILYNNMVIYFI